MTVFEFISYKYPLKLFSHEDGLRLQSSKLRMSEQELLNLIEIQNRDVTTNYHDATNILIG